MLHASVVDMFNLVGCLIVTLCLLIWLPKHRFALQHLSYATGKAILVLALIATILAGMLSLFFAVATVTHLRGA